MTSTDVAIQNAVRAHLKSMGVQPTAVVLDAVAKFIAEQLDTIEKRVDQAAPTTEQLKTSIRGLVAQVEAALDQYENGGQIQGKGADVDSAGPIVRLLLGKPAFRSKP
jgi:hypothetical protein